MESIRAFTQMVRLIEKLYYLLYKCNFKSRVEFFFKLSDFDNDELILVKHKHQGDQNQIYQMHMHVHMHSKPYN